MRYSAKTLAPVVGKLVIAVYFIATRAASFGDSIVAYYHPRVPVSNAIFALSFIDHQLGAYGFTTYGESSGGLHVFSLISVPFVSTFGPEGIRIAGIVLTATTVMLVYYLGKQLYGESSAIVASAVLTVSPMYQFFATAGFPEVFELFSGTVAVLGFVSYSRSRRSRWLLLSVGALILGILDHAWLALVYAPIALTAATRRDWRLLTAYTVSTVGAVATIVYLSLVAGSGSTVRAYSVLYHYDVLLDPSFYVDFTINAIGFALSPPLGLVVLIAAVYYLVARSNVLIASWTLAGMSPILLFPRGASIHFYYLWGLLIPGSILAAVLTEDIANVLTGRLRDRDFGSVGRFESKTVVKSIGVAGVVALLLVSSVIVGPLGLVMPAKAESQVVQSGTCVGDIVTEEGVDSGQIALVTALNINKTEYGETLLLHSYLGYAGLYVGGPDSPVRYESVQSAKRAGVPLIIDFRNGFSEGTTGVTPVVLFETTGGYDERCTDQSGAQ